MTAAEVTSPRPETVPVPRARPSGSGISVVICACADERFEELADAIRSIEAQTVPALETVVVVDHNPALANRARERWRDVVVVENVDRRGVSASRNAGVARSRGAIVAFLDDDAIAAPDWLARMLGVYARDTVMAVGGDVAPLWQTGRPAWFPDEFGWVVGCSYTGLPDHPAPVRNVIGANMSFRRDVFAEIGGFDTAVGRVGRSPAGCDETEFCIRARRRWRGRTIVYDPCVRVSHRVPARRSSLAYFVSRCYGEGRSKALVSELVGSRDALSTEVGYATRILPAGVVHGLRDAVGGDRSGLGRAATITAGLAATSAGFLAARVAGATLRRRTPPAPGARCAS